MTDIGPARTAMVAARSALERLEPGQRMVVVAGLLAEACVALGETSKRGDTAMSADLMFGSAARMVLDQIKTLTTD